MPDAKTDRTKPRRKVLMPHDIKRRYPGAAVPIVDVLFGSRRICHAPPTRGGIAGRRWRGCHNSAAPFSFEISKQLYHQITGRRQAPKHDIITSEKKARNNAVSMVK